MKLTSEELKKIIKEEIHSVVNEIESGGITITPEDQKAGEEMAQKAIAGKAPKLKSIFDDILKDPAVQQELKNIVQLKEQTGSPGAGATAMIGAMANTAMNASAIQSALLAGLTTGKLGPAVAAALKAAGLAGGALATGAAAGLAAYVALGGAAALLGKASMSLKPGSPEGKALDDKIENMKIGDIDPDLGKLISKNPARFEAV